MAGQIHRRKKETGFVVLDVHCLQNAKLKWDAKGLHSYLMQLPDDWQINMADLETRSASGREATASPMRALIEAGYVVRRRVIAVDGRFEGYDYDVFEYPQEAATNGKAVNGLSVNGKTVNGFSVNGKPATIKNEVKIELKESKNEGKEETRENALTPPAEIEISSLEAKKEKKEMVAPAAPREFSPTPPVAVILYEQISGTPTKVAIHEPEAATSTAIKPRTAKPAPKPRTVEIPESHKELAPQIMELLTKRPYLTKSDAALTREMTLFFSLPAKFCQWHIQNSLDRSKGVWDSLMYAGWEETYQRWLRLQPPAPGAAPLQAIRQTNFRNPTEAYWEPSQYRRQK